VRDIVVRSTRVEVEPLRVPVLAPGREHKVLTASHLALPHESLSSALVLEFSDSSGQRWRSTDGEAVRRVG